MLIHRPTQKVILNSSNPERITTVIPTAKIFEYQGRQLVAVPHKLDETKVLRNLGYDVPAPILHHYQWSGEYDPFKAQEATAAFLTLNKKAFVFNDLGCVDSETEYLSPTGWKRIADYTDGDVGQYHPDTGQVTMVAPTKYVRLPCPEMYHIKTKYGIDQMLSPEHRMLVHSANNPCKSEVLQAHTLYSRQEKWLAGGGGKGKITEIGFCKATIPVTFNYAGPGLVGVSDADLRLQVAVIADGHFPNHTDRCVIRVKKQRKIDRLKSLLAAAGRPYKESFGKGSAGGFSVITFAAPLRIKHFDDRFWACSHAQLSVVTDEVMHWDGSVSDTKPTQRFSSFVKDSSDFVQYAYAASGRTARVIKSVRERRGHTETEWTVLVRDNGKPLQIAGTGVGGKIKSMNLIPSTDGFKYCFMVPSTFLIFRRNGCIFASGNTGKTLSALWAYDYLNTHGLANKLLVISPLSTLERTWADEIFRHFPHMNSATLHGHKAHRQRMLDTDADIYLINHHGMGILEPELLARRDIDTIIIDEIAVFRNASTTLWKTLSRIIAGRANVWGMTGTPTPNAPTDAWAQCRLLVPERVPKHFRGFREATMRPMGPFNWVAKDTATAVVSEAMQPSIRFSREDCVDLPECQMVQRHVPMSTEQAKTYKEMAAKLAVEINSQQITAVTEASKIIKLLQIACGVVYDAHGNEVALPAEPRLQEVIDTIEAAATKVIVFCPFKSVVYRLAQQLQERLFPADKFGHLMGDYDLGQVASFTGETSKTNRDKILTAFQKGLSLRILVASPAAMSHGLTLTAASTIIWYAPINSNETYQQANGRITRPGQKNSQLIVNIESTPLEKKMYDRLRKKESMQGLLLDAVKGA